MNLRVKDIEELRNVEQRILNYMLLSKEKYNFVKKEIDEEYFTFYLYKNIFHALISFEPFNNNDFYISNEVIISIGELLENKITITKNIVLDVLFSQPSINIKYDIEFLRSYYEIKKKKLEQSLNEIFFIFESDSNYTHLKFNNDVLILVYTTDINNLPFELIGLTFTESSEKATKIIDISENSKLLYDKELFMPGVHMVNGLYFHKNISEFEWFYNLYEWANLYEIDKDIFPRSIFLLKQLEILDLSEYPIFDLPQEFKYLKQLKQLYLNSKYLHKIPSSIYELSNLKQLILSNYSSLENIDNTYKFEIVFNNK